eukprot:8601240-Pyramimonas_sp.AAC.1
MTAILNSHIVIWWPLYSLKSSIHPCTASCSCWYMSIMELNTQAVVLPACMSARHQAIRPERSIT